MRKTSSKQYKRPLLLYKIPENLKGGLARILSDCGFSEDLTEGRVLDDLHHVGGKTGEVASDRAA